ncbi:phage tail protein [Selenomonas sp. AB3002]|uniref:phage tail sheath family protein n=1 Tax=Selenomonas sp. AB3002 TaxID=1392502 RepID=UPI00049648A0
MSYKHGIYTGEVATSLVPMTQTDSGLIIAFGTAPVHLASDPAAVNTPVLCYTYAEAVAAFGYSAEWDKYTLCEVMKTHFALFNMAPIVLVNVLDKDSHKAAVTQAECNLTDKVGTITDPALLEGIKVYAATDGEELVADTDYTAAHDDDGNLIITALSGGAIASASKVYVSYTKLTPTTVVPADIIGGIDIATNKAEGLELIDEIYPRFGLVPGIIIAPGWSSNVNVAAVMKAKEHNICGHFNAISICDIPTETVKTYTAASEWKNANIGADKDCILCWPLLKQGDEVFHLSTQLASVMNYTDAQHDDIPYYSPSNKSLQANGACLADGTEIYLNNAQAAYLNGQGVVTALNFIGGWKSWGNRTTAYPSNTDVKDNFIPIRRMFNWIGNTLITTFWNKIDDPMNKRFIETIVDSANIWLNGLTAKGALLGGRVEFREDENTTTGLMDGIIYFHVYITPPSPAREIHFVQEYDPDYISTLFA